MKLPKKKTEHLGNFMNMETTMKDGFPLDSFNIENLLKSKCDASHSLAPFEYYVFSNNWSVKRDISSNKSRKCHTVRYIRTLQHRE